MIQLKNVTKQYGKKTGVFTALDKVNFEVEQGATVAIIGKSGSGKSTLMHIISGLDHASKGTITINGQNLAQMKSREVDRFRSQEMSFIFQSFFVEANQTCLDNVMLPLEIAKTKPSTRRSAALEALESVELKDKVNEKGRNLSGGQKQRLAIARAIVNKPKIIFADEPTGNLDTVTGEKIIKLLFGLNKKLGSTLFVVTHDHDLAARCQIKIHLKDGRISKIESNRVAK